MKNKQSFFFYDDHQEKSVTMNLFIFFYFLFRVYFQHYRKSLELGEIILKLETDKGKILLF